MRTSREPQKNKFLVVTGDDRSDTASKKTYEVGKKIMRWQVRIHMKIAKNRKAVVW